MFKLIQLEIKKFKFTGVIKGILITDIIILSLVLVQVASEPTDSINANLETVFRLIETFLRYIFIVYASVLLGRYVIDEYKNKTITVLFTYPISRKKLIYSKLIIVSSFTIFSILFSVLVVSSTFYFINNFVTLIPQVLPNNLWFMIFEFILNAITSSIIIMIPLYLGLRKKSVPTTIVTGVIIIGIIGLTNYGLPLYIVLSGIGVLFVYLSLRNIEKVDID